MDTRHAHGAHTYLKAKHSYIQNKSKIKKKKTGGVIKEDTSLLLHKYCTTPHII